MNELKLLKDGYSERKKTYKFKNLIIKREK